MRHDAEGLEGEQTHFGRCVEPFEVGRWVLFGKARRAGSSKAAASRAFGPVTLGAAVYWSPDFFGADDQATYVEANASFSPAPKWTVSGAVGHQALDVNADYATWNAGVAYAFTDNVAIDLRYHDTDVTGPLSDDRAVAALKFLF